MFRGEPIYSKRRKLSYVTDKALVYPSTVVFMSNSLSEPTVEWALENSRCCCYCKFLVADISGAIIGSLYVLDIQNDSANTSSC